MARKAGSPTPHREYAAGKKRPSTWDTKVDSDSDSSSIVLEAPEDWDTPMVFFWLANVVDADTSTSLAVPAVMALTCYCVQQQVVAVPLVTQWTGRLMTRLVW